MKYKSFTCLIISLFVSMVIQAQTLESQSSAELAVRIQPAPEAVFNMFREAGMQPVNHVLTDKEKDKVKKAFTMLPPLHRKILEEHLHSISFMDNIPNTALTYPVETADSINKFNITFRAEIINETISQWATWKENTYYSFSEGNEFEINVEGGDLDAIVYILLHEATHVVDAVLELTPHPRERDAFVEPTPFTQGIWHKMNLPEEAFIGAVLETIRFRSGKPVPVSQAPEVYKALKKTPFASLYSMAAWFEDLAELVSIYHLTENLNQPFRISIKKNGKEVVNFEPMKNELVKKRLDQLKVFYK